LCKHNGEIDECQGRGGDVMERINSESFEKVLRDKHGIEWDVSHYSRYGFTRAAEPEELIGIMVSELLGKSESWELFIDNEADCKESYFTYWLGNVKSGGESLYQALRKAVEGIEW